MVKTLVSIIVAALVIVGGGIAENAYLSATFDGLTDVYEEIYHSSEQEKCTVGQAESAKKAWFDKKKTLHALIPHTEIKEVDLWVYELTEYVRQGNFKEASAKAYVILELFDKIPKTFSISLENLL